MKLNGFLPRSLSFVRLMQTSASAPATKSPLATLRRRTGYTFANCKKALEQFGDDLPKAEAWLRDQAQKEGWAKATKLQDRVAAQGLVGIRVKPEDGLGVLVEVNCETDFVARNGKFQELVCTIAEACTKELDMKAIDGASYHKWSLTPDRISSFKWAQGKTLGDLTALTIGQMGENMVLRRAVLVKADPRECKISGYAHSADNAHHPHNCLLGRFGALVVYRQTPNPEALDPQLTPTSLTDFGRQLCQHVVGMNPQSIGSLEDEPIQRPPPPPPQSSPAPPAAAPETAATAPEGGALQIPVVGASATATEGQVPEGEQDDQPVTYDRIQEDETRLVHQEFLGDTSMTVGEALLQNGVEVLDFVRFECGGGRTEEA
ncbi:elongation factor Ts, mitochondrial-like [Paramacrobiotus metropolitanus]|uniref:elongation factor Ts, mitochondrial-like n=1 Tax=Paramacrobiotus metropolitanus TaxID=2943436 RepID=UPI00244609A9|nr:elongation factor Ts, mitochondrial-like [Paramacrobiotus metropolitanus]